MELQAGSRKRSKFCEVHREGEESSVNKEGKRRRLLKRIAPNLPEANGNNRPPMSPINVW